VTELAGRVWKFGDDISTDLLMPGDVAAGRRHDPEGRRAQFLACMRANRPGWAEQVVPGDLLIAGHNFGCGSSRPAQRILRGLGIAAVVAESTSRIFFRNCINIGYPVLICPTATGLFEELEEAHIDLETGTVTNTTTGRWLQGEALRSDTPPGQILGAGGLEKFFIRQLAERASSQER
jgi:3-isopropylmalate/(R)-2-methylmalate dehydratase small subunit